AFGSPALWTQRALDAVDTDWTQTRALLERQASFAYAQAIASATRELTDIAHRAVAVPDSSAASFAALQSMLGTGLGERGVVLVHGGRPTAWAGIVRVPLDSLHDSAGVAQTTFYPLLYATATRGAARAV